MAVKWIVALAFTLILGSLLSAFLQMLKRGGNRKRMVQALTVRITLSVLLFIGLLVAAALGLIHGNGMN
ncbi:hypothetical protein BH10PSE17_BH10PSE17_38610 [soil metagenome]